MVGPVLAWLKADHHSAVCQRMGLCAGFRTMGGAWHYDPRGEVDLERWVREGRIHRLVPAEVTR